MIRRSGRTVRRSALALGLVLASAIGALAQSQSVGPSGLPLPRFASTKFNEVNVRAGPSRDHDVVWKFMKSGIPVEITQEFDIWLRIRDSEGDEGWVQKSLLSGKRGGFITPWEKKGTVPLRDKPDPAGRIVANLDPKVLVEILECTGQWCRVSAAGNKGWVDQSRLWGAYPGESFR